MNYIFASLMLDAARVVETLGNKGLQVVAATTTKGRISVTIAAPATDSITLLRFVSSQGFPCEVNGDQEIRTVIAGVYLYIVGVVTV